jgi:hypothetical protein
MNKPPAQTILRWLRDNGIKLGALTSHDKRALLAATQIAECWICGDNTNRPMAEVAFRNTVLQMQEKTRFMAFHAIAHVGDWCHRSQLWHAAELPEGDVLGRPECSYGPRKEAA